MKNGIMGFVNRIPSIHISRTQKVCMALAHQFDLMGTRMGPQTRVVRQVVRITGAATHMIFGNQEGIKIGLGRDYGTQPILNGKRFWKIGFNALFDLIQGMRRLVMQFGL
jgi:hypothetical protein